ncbi:homoserine O-acetyltransferase [Siphonobacter sp. BAB-5405]|uniref:homoserine O-acetyltransferase family protein n=1 Tax=Siphonobacter sp. BAB-5405 TaxID=1864825 RepID=UPI000C806C8E|nr:homoserine O-acetyltransferase [Siphonobacter sp. BAB-5405]
MSALQKFHYPQEFALECGRVLPEIELAYHTFGTLNATASNVVWICHALTGNSDVTDWWSGLVGEGKLLDTRQYFIVCANVPGSAYGSTSALSIDPLTQEPYYQDFPLITIRDVVKSLDLLREHLNLQQIRMLVGGSLGGQQALEWAIQKPDLFEQLILIATNARMSPWGIAFNESQRMAIEADQTWQERRPDAGTAGMKAARATALLSYRSAVMYEFTQAREESALEHYRASSYQRYQGEKIGSRFNAFSYYTLSRMMDSHDVGRNRDGAMTALNQIKAQTLIIGIQSDVLFPVEEQRFLARYIPNAELTEIDSLYGHDGFLVENELMTKTIRTWELSNQLGSAEEEDELIVRDRVRVDVRKGVREYIAVDNISFLAKPYTIHLISGHRIESDTILDKVSQALQDSYDFSDLSPELPHILANMRNIKNFDEKTHRIYLSDGRSQTLPPAFPLKTL